MTPLDLLCDAAVRVTRLLEAHVDGDAELAVLIALDHEHDLVRWIERLETEGMRQ